VGGSGGSSIATSLQIALLSLSYHHGHHATKLLWWKWCCISERKSNLIKPSGWIVAEDVAVKAIVAELVLQSYFSCKR
jgi:hypothetical protein